MTSIQVYGKINSIEAEGDVNNICITDIDMSLLIGQLNAKEVLEALKANDQYQEIVDYVSDEESDGKYELPGFSDSMDQLNGLGR